MAKFRETGRSAASASQYAIHKPSGDQLSKRTLNPSGAMNGSMEMGVISGVSVSDIMVDAAVGGATPFAGGEAKSSVSTGDCSLCVTLVGEADGIQAESARGIVKRRDFDK
ncbi:MAG TPA: hypothetical protein VMN57_10720 [Anaerolineales bacterium]|nr:hypothetical protein [Anaerolineales bacterium]